MAEQMRYMTWQEMHVGTEFKTLRRTITETDLVNFVNASGLIEPLFVDVPYVTGSSPYGGRLIPEPLIYAYAEGLSVQGGGFGRSGLALLGVEIKMLRPTFVGDTIDVRIIVTESRASKTEGRGVVTTTNSVVNQHDEVVMIYKPVRLVADSLIGDD